MSVMEKRLQLLLDQERYARVAAEAQRSGRSVAAVIREAIDFRFDVEADQQRRSQAARWLLETSREPQGVEEDWPDIKAAMEQELVDKYDRLYEDAEQ